MKPVKRSKQAARQNYDRLSRWYDLIAGSSEAKYRQIGLQALAACPGERVLEIGFGTGHALQDLAESVGANGQVIGIDLSAGMAQRTQARLKKSDPALMPSLLLADGAQPPLQAESCDAVFMSFTLELFASSEIPSVLAQCRRILRPNGRLAVVCLYRRTPPGLAEKFYEWFHQRMPVLVDCRPIPASQLIQQAGFTLAQREQRSLWGLPVEVLGAHNLPD